MSDVTSRAWWRWMPGMGIWRLSESSGQICHNRLTEAWPEPDPSGWQPVEDDPATLGCLTQRARELWGDPGAYVRPVSVPGGDVWILHAMVRDGRRSERGPVVDADGRWISGPTEFAALLAACDAAPGGAT